MIPDRPLSATNVDLLAQRACQLAGRSPDAWASFTEEQRQSWRAFVRDLDGYRRELIADTAVPLARGDDPDTSRKAARSLDPRQIRSTHRAVLAVLHERGPLSDEGIAHFYAQLRRERGWPRQSPSGLRTRRSELADAGLVVDSGRRLRLASRREAIVWTLSQAGTAAA